MSKKHWIYIKRGLSQSAKHREEMGNRIWVYMHILDRADWETGIVYDWRDRDEAEDMGMPWRTLQQQRQELAALGYITCRQRRSGQEIVIHRWSNPRSYSGEVINLPEGYGDLSTQGTAEGTVEGTVKGSSNLRIPSNLDQRSRVIKAGAGKPRPPDLHFEALAEVCKLAPPDRNWSALAPTLRGPLNRYAKELRGMGAAPADIAAFGPWWYANDWRGLKNPPQPPSPADVVKEWPRFLLARQQPQQDEPLPERIRLAQAELRNFRGPNE